MERGDVFPRWFYRCSFKYFNIFKNDLNHRVYFDNISAVAPIGLFLGRISNFINGELYGTETQKPWGVVFPKLMV